LYIKYAKLQFVKYYTYPVEDFIRDFRTRKKISEKINFSDQFGNASHADVIKVLDRYLRTRLVTKGRVTGLGENLANG
jgi:hypothetical protein